MDEKIREAIAYLREYLIRYKDKDYADAVYIEMLQTLIDYAQSQEATEGEIGNYMNDFLFPY